MTVCNNKCNNSNSHWNVGGLVAYTVCSEAHRTQHLALYVLADSMLLPYIPLLS